jgi:adenylylsulfate kinase-like enzyme
VTTIAPYVSAEMPWTQEQRQEQIRRMGEAARLDQEAVEALQTALSETMTLVKEIAS